MRQQGRWQHHRWCGIAITQRGGLRPAPFRASDDITTFDAMGAAVTCIGLTKSFGSTVALEGLDLDVCSGEIHGFLGPNGAGKTVTMRILLGLLRSDGGLVEVFGRDPWTDAVDLHRRIAYVPGDTNLWPNLTGGEILDVLGGLHGGVDTDRRADLVRRFELDLRKRARGYSKGNRQKVALIAALAADVDLLVLDEPTSGLDPLMEAVFRDEIFAARADGRAILLSSHVLGEVEKTCDRVTIVRHGRTLQTGTLEEMRHLTRAKVHAHLQRPLLPDDSTPWARHLEVDGEAVSFDVESADLDAAVTALAALGLQSLECHPPTLEELFLSHYRDELDANGPDPITPAVAVPGPTG
jgi:ABC-2 type transport system ATP-binding protein